MSKVATITLETYETIDKEKGPPHLWREWHVTKVTDSIEFQPGQVLLKPQVEEICASKQWRVTITAPKNN